MIIWPEYEDESFGSVVASAPSPRRMRSATGSATSLHSIPSCNIKLPVLVKKSEVTTITPA
jgi:hypothetical protein